jgi:hypothetical protein
MLETSTPSADREGQTPFGCRSTLLAARFRPRAEVHHWGFVLAWAATMASSGCSKSPCEVTLTCPPSEGGMSGSGAGGAGAGVMAGTKVGSSGGDAGDVGGETEAGGTTGAHTTDDEGAAAGKTTGGEGGTPPDACDDGSCTTGRSCTPKQRRCDTGSGVPQLCSAEGEWENEGSCRTDQVCSGGACLCRAEFTTCGDECVTLDDNPKHCGRCGHDCLGGECTEGKCQPFEIAYGQYLPQKLAVDATHVYWIDHTDNVGSVRRVAKHGGNVQILATDQGYPRGLVVSSGKIYWDSTNPPAPGAIYQSSVDGTNRAKFAEAPAVVYGLSLASDVLFWNGVDDDDKVRFFSKALRSSAEPTPLVDDGDGGSNMLTAVDNCVFYRTVGATSGYDLRQSCDGEPSVSRFSTSKLIALSSTASADSANLYFGAEGLGVMRLPLSGSASATALVAGRKVLDVVVDGDQIYYIEGDNGAAQNCTSNWTIYRTAAVAGATPVPIVPPPQECAAYLATDDAAVYWVNSTTSGSIHLIAK